MGPSCQAVDSAGEAGDVTGILLMRMRSTFLLLITALEILTALFCCSSSGAVSKHLKASESSPLQSPLAIEEVQGL